jgi:hypothetical protein
MHSSDKPSLSTLVTTGLMRVPVKTDTQIATDEYTNCWIECSVFGSRTVINGHVIYSQVSGRQPSLKSVVRSSRSGVISKKDF